ncbi:hypothetical protein GCM10009681_08940 [Luedemannella helvata]|uniref:Uncharacterized protein n=1 Tax=Luedemannella helvata TaxID=349315 RepID=A0ABP4VWR5_9ACTN
MLQVLAHLRDAAQVEHPVQVHDETSAVRPGCESQVHTSLPLDTDAPPIPEITLRTDRVRGSFAAGIVRATGNAQQNVPGRGIEKLGAAGQGGNMNYLSHLLLPLVRAWG